MSQIKVNKIDNYSFLKSIMFAVGGHYDCSPSAHRTLPTPLLSGIKMKGTYLALSLLANWWVAVETNILDIKYSKSTALNWMACLQVAEDVSCWMVATLLDTDVCHLLDGPWICASTMQESVHRNGTVEGQCGLSVKSGQQYSCTELEPWYW